MRLLVLLVCLLAVTSCQLALYYQNHTQDSVIDVDTSASADSSTISVTIPKVKTN